MNFKFSVVVFIVFIILVACGEDNPPYPYGPDLGTGLSSVVEEESSSSGEYAPSSATEERKDMVLVERSNEKVEIAENMYVTLNYDYLIGKHEVTCEEYGDKSCSGNIPVVNVTFFDVVLFANSKSKSEKLDTVYTYSSAKYDSQNHCTYLENLETNLDREGYRLPTEAEWIKAASLNWNAKNSWNGSNSENKPHEVCSKQKAESKFCDFEGNVTEWVNDWFAPATKASFNNFIGAATPNGLGERVIKGGNFTNDVQSITLYSRSDVYTVTSSTRTDYVGFRLALGKIPNAESIKSESKSEQKMVQLATSSVIRDITGSNNVKLAFRNDVSGNLVYVSYSDVALSLIEIQDTLNVFHPDISPDGNWVAFCTNIEGVDSKSSLYVRKLNSSGSDLVQLEVENATIPRWGINANGDTVITYVTNAGNNKETEDWKRASTWQVVFSNGHFGIPQKLFDGSYHGGISEDASLAVSGARLLRVRKAKPESTIYDVDAVDTVWYNGEQACNVSLVQDGTLRTLFLDFAGKTGKEFVGKPYYTHQRIFIADKNGSLIQSIEAPAGYTFDHTEWATDGETSNIVATLANVDGGHEKIVLVNVKDSSVTNLIQGEELWHPCLWVSHKAKSSNEDSTKIDFELDRDSAGVYFVAGGSEIEVKWKYKMELFWKYYDSMNTAIIGSSRSLHGVNPEQLNHGFKALNLANSNCDLYCTKFYLEHYVLTHMKNLKYIVMSVDLDLSHVSLPSSYFEAHRSGSPGFVYDEHHEFWKDGVPKQLAQLTYESLGYYQFEGLRETYGFQGLAGRGWGNPDVLTDSMWITTRRYLFDATFEALEEMVAETNERGIKFLAVIFPQNPKYVNTGSLTCHGFQRSAAPAIIQQISDLSKVYPNFVLMDENKMGYHDYTDEMAYDHNHLSVAGATQITARIDSALAVMAK